MIINKPDYYDNFKCSADKCTDTCCDGWQFDLDDKTRLKYSTVKGEFGQRLKCNVNENHGEYFFKPTLSGKCPFLNDDGLCDIIINLGEDYLCDICAKHPRFVHYYGNVKEYTLFASCPTVAKILAKKLNPISFISQETEELPPPNEADAETLKQMINVRNIAIEIIQNRSLAISLRLKKLIRFASFAQKSYKNLDLASFDSYLNIKGYDKPVSPKVGNTCIKDVLSFFFCKNEILTDKWKIMLDQTIDGIYDCSNSYSTTTDVAIENFTVYLLYGYMLRAIYDKKIESWIKFAVVGALTVAELIKFTGVFTGENCADVIHMFSKEIEHSVDNVERTVKACKRSSTFKSKHLLASIDAIFR